MTKAWWLGFPKLKCPLCGGTIVGIKFEGRWRMPKKATLLHDVETERKVTGP
jgi:hypothetical protein